MRLDCLVSRRFKKPTINILTSVSTLRAGSEFSLGFPFDCLARDGIRLTNATIQRDSLQLPVMFKVSAAVSGKLIHHCGAVLLRGKVRENPRM